MTNKEYNIIFAFYSYENAKTNEEKEKWLNVINELKEGMKNEEK